MGQPSQNSAQPCARVQGYVNDDIRADGLQKGWSSMGFRVNTWNVEHVRHCQTENLTWHAFKKHDGKVVAASSMELKEKDISCSGWEMRRDRTV